VNVPKSTIELNRMVMDWHRSLQFKEKSIKEERTWPSGRDHNTAKARAWFAETRFSFAESSPAIEISALILCSDRDDPFRC
jgi:hypothetical protein